MGELGELLFPAVMLIGTIVTLIAVGAFIMWSAHERDRDMRRAAHQAHRI